MSQLRWRNQRRQHAVGRSAVFLRYSMPTAVYR